MSQHTLHSSIWRTKYVSLQQGSSVTNLGLWQQLWFQWPGTGPTKDLPSQHLEWLCNYQPSWEVQLFYRIFVGLLGDMWCGEATRKFGDYNPRELVYTIPFQLVQLHWKVGFWHQDGWWPEESSSQGHVSTGTSTRCQFLQDNGPTTWFRGIPGVLQGHSYCGAEECRDKMAYWGYYSWCWHVYMIEELCYMIEHRHSLRFQ